MTTQGAAILAILVVVVLVLFGLGRFLRNRSPLLKITGLIGLMLLVFLSIALIGSATGIGIYQYDQFPSCDDTTSQCATVHEQEQSFEARIPRLAVWMTVPKPLRPACETISPEFCDIQKTYDFAVVGYIVGAFGTLIALFIFLLGLRQKRVTAVQLDSSLPT
ncbi:MAG: hypothetical protein ABI970_22005 [Chloroflexota bacterium]